MGMGELVVIKDGILKTTSLQVAEAFGKRHDNVLRAIDNLDCDKDFSLLNFEEIDYVDDMGRKQRMVEMTRDGWMLLVMGFTGEKAATARVAFIREFNRMEKNQLSIGDTLPAILQQLTDLTTKQSKEQRHIKNRQGENTFKIREHDHRITNLELGKRKKFPVKAKAIFVQVVERNYANLCPCCQVQTVPPMEIDHFYLRSKNKKTEGWAICKECHKELSSGRRTRESVTTAFNLFQKRVEEYMQVERQPRLPGHG